MSMKTVFYSWQSDTPAGDNRNFIESALKLALKKLRSDAEVTLALRESDLQIDQDTEGVPGSPPIAETILKKIRESTVIVADLTYIGESVPNVSGRAKRLLSNPNVLLEYGYALRCHSHAGIIGVLNTAYGGKDLNELPFDLRHLRGPLTYHLNDKNTSRAKEVLAALADGLAARLKDILLTPPTPVVSQPRALFVPVQPSTEDSAVFWAHDKDIAPVEDFGNVRLDRKIPNVGRAFLRLHPKYETPRISSALKARDLLRKGQVRPMGMHVRGWGHDRNAFGAIAYEGTDDARITGLTQMFLSWELWGVDAYAVNATRCREFMGGKSNGFIMSHYVERSFTKTLINYLKFYQKTKPEISELIITAGLTGIKGYPMAVGDHAIRGHIFNDEIIWTAEISDVSTPADKLLAPLFERIWEEAGLSRPQEAADNLAENMNALSSWDGPG